MTPSRATSFGRIATSGSTTAAFRAGIHDGSAATATTTSAITAPTSGVLSGTCRPNRDAITYNAAMLRQAQHDTQHAESNAAHEEHADDLARTRA
jgi:hypothetical protein